MPEDAPPVVVIAGSNGVGKSTAAPWVLSDLLGIHQFVNADVIAQGLSAFEPEKAAMQAGRVMLTRLKELAMARESFAFETTMASRSFAPWIDGLCQSGYKFHLVFLYVPSPELSVLRVAGRVRAGGHHVPDDVIRRRYIGGLRNFFALYQPLATGWHFYNSSNPGRPTMVAAGVGTTEVAVFDAPLWKSIKESFK